MYKIITVLKSFSKKSYANGGHSADMLVHFGVPGFLVNCTIMISVSGP
jgi:hypothetical protein